MKQSKNTGLKMHLLLGSMLTLALICGINYKNGTAISLVETVEAQQPTKNSVVLLGVPEYIPDANAEVTEEPSDAYEAEETLPSLLLTDDLVLERGQKLVSLGIFYITEYCPCEICSEGWGKQTASGAECVEGTTVAVDTSVIPLGTHLAIRGHEFIAQDVGGMINENHIDIYREHHSDCYDDWNGYYEVFVIVSSEAE